MKKESLSIIIVKTLLAVVIFAGMGIIIIGGGYIVGEYSKNRENKGAIKEPSEEWRICNQDSNCIGIRLGCACYIEDAINKVYLNNWTNILQERCGDNCMMDLRLQLPSDNTINKAVCENSRCELRQEKEINCTQNAALDFLDDKQGNDPCDRSCEFDSDCKLECGCECISKDEECEYTGIECEMPNPDYGCQCVNQKCKYNYIGTNADTSDWQTYRNKKFGFEVKYPKEYEKNKNYSIWKLDEGGMGLISEWGINRGQETIFVVSVYPKIKKTEVLNHFNHQILEDKVLLNNVEAKRLKGMGIYDDLFIEQEEYFYIIHSSFSSNVNISEYQEYKNILSTFRFIEKDISDWQIYRNEEYGFEVKYPEDYNIVAFPQLNEYQKSQGMIYLSYLKHSDVNASISIRLTSINFNLQDIKQRFAPTGNESFPEQIRAGQNTFYFYGFGGGGVSYPDNYFYNLNGKVLIISFDDPYIRTKTLSNETRQLESRILSSFKFIEKDDIYNWQTYQNEEFGFEVKYPENDAHIGLGKFKVEQIENTFYIAHYDYKDITKGQFVKIFTKDSKDSLKQAIEKRFLKKFSKEECFVNEKNINYLFNYSKNCIVLSAIDYPNREEHPFENKNNCPYAAFNGKSYFLMDINYPDKFAFFSIGQYSIPAALEGVEIFWQDTFKFIEK
ncbi:hypothetical protein KAI52_01385 [Candidatus Parcubacteria bacterium]|nr:hypothetical protein [Candidatus Parcubacteria bacterium]